MKLHGLYEYIYIFYVQQWSHPTSLFLKHLTVQNVRSIRRVKFTALCHTSVSKAFYSFPQCWQVTCVMYFIFTLLWQFWTWNTNTWVDLNVEMTSCTLSQSHSNNLVTTDKSENTGIILHTLPNNSAIFYFITVEFLFSESLGEWLFLHPFKLCTSATT
jgi:hypothetical protein